MATTISRSPFPWAFSQPAKSASQAMGIDWEMSRGLMRLRLSTCEKTRSKLRATEGSREIGGEWVARLRVAPQAGQRRVEGARQPQGAAQSLVVPQEIADARKTMLLKQPLVLSPRAVLQPEHGRGQRLRGGRRTVGAEDQHVDHRRRQLAQLVADGANERGPIGGRGRGGAGGGGAAPPPPAQRGARVGEG